LNDPSDPYVPSYAQLDSLLGLYIAITVTLGPYAGVNIERYSQIFLHIQIFRFNVLLYKDSTQLALARVNLSFLITTGMVSPDTGNALSLARVVQKEMPSQLPK